MGCLLFAWWYGYSPFECEFIPNISNSISPGQDSEQSSKSHSGRGNGFGSVGRTDVGAGSIGNHNLSLPSILKVVECSHLRVLSKIPQNPNPSYEDEIVREIVEFILVTEMTERPLLSDVIYRVRTIRSGLLTGGGGGGGGGGKGKVNSSWQESQGSASGAHLV
jgi:hypothetical protein